MLRDDLIDSCLDVADLMDLGIFVVGIDLDLDRVVLAEGDDILDQAVAVKLVLDQLGGHILAVAEDDQVLLAAVQIEVAVLVHVAEISCAEPAVLRDCLRRQLRIIDVAHHDRGALDLDLAVHKPHLAAAHWPADRLDLVHVSIVGRRDLGRALRHAVALAGDNAQVRQPPGQRLRQVAAAADDLVEPRSHDLGLEIFQILVGMLLRGNRDTVEQHLGHHGHDPQHGRLEKVDIIEEFGDVIAQAKGAAVPHDQQQVAAEAEDMVDGQDAQAGLPSVIGAEQVVQQVGVREHDALSVPCRA